MALQRFLSCRTEEVDLDLDGEKEALCFKEISTALRGWILPALVSVRKVMMMVVVEDAAQTSLRPRRTRG